MKIRDTQFKHSPFDVAIPLAEFLISTGKFSEYIDPSTIKQPSVMSFGILESPDPFTPPSITHSCPGCSLVGHTTSQKGTAHKNPIYHCGQQSLPDEQTADAYVKQFKAWSRAKDSVTEEPTPQPKRVFFAEIGR